MEIPEDGPESRRRPPIFLVLFSSGKYAGMNYYCPQF